MSKRRRKRIWLIECPYDHRGFDTITEFLTHLRRKHATILDGEADRLTIFQLDRALARRIASARNKLEIA